MIDWDQEFEDQARREAAGYDPEKTAQKRAEEFRRGVRLGWWTEDGTPIQQESDEVDDDEVDE